jgi:hypothetical protein
LYINYCDTNCASTIVLKMQFVAIYIFIVGRKFTRIFNRPYYNIFLSEYLRNMIRNINANLIISLI